MMSDNPEVEDAISTLEGWLPNECRDYVELVARLLSSLPGGDEAEDMGYEPIPYLGWQEADMIGKLLSSVCDSRDVAEAVRRLFGPPTVEDEDDADDQTPSA
ncbi:MAG: hypothetical protein ACREC5_07790 [Thermoplasmata archaeon]